jgi:uncharacterized alkaline shock family protein YloU
MNKEESRTDLGLVRIHRNVIASIATVASTEVEGVKRVGTSLKSGVLEMIGKKSYSAIGVEFDKNGEVKVEIPLVIKYGYNIPDVADKVQENIRTALEKMTNLTIKDININIQAIERG